MIDPVVLVRTRLLAVPSVTALTTSSRVYAGILAQKSLLPAIAIQIVSDVEDSHLRGPDGLKQARIQVHAVASNRIGAVALADAAEGRVGTGLNHFRGAIAGATVRLIERDGAQREEWRAGVLNEYEVMRGYMVHFVMN